MKRYTILGTVVVLAHALIATVHGLAHKHLAIELSLIQKLFVLSVITLAPLLAMILLWTRVSAAGAGLLVFSMVGSLIFGVVYHFVIPSADHVLHLPASSWRLAFQITAALLSVTEILGLWLGVKALWESKEQSAKSESP